VNVKAVSVDDVIASLKVAVTVVLTATPVAPLVGVTELTVGATGVVDLLEPPQPEMISADARRQAIPKRMMRYLLDFLWAERMTDPTRNPERKLWHLHDIEVAVGHRPVSGASRPAIN
jgi:hypothetical protein